MSKRESKPEEAPTVGVAIALATVDAAVSAYEAATATAPIVPEYVRGPAPVEAIVDRWFVETFHNRQIDPDEINRLSAARDRLKALLVAAAKE